MIFNMATDNSDNNSLPLLNPAQNQQSPCGFNFLKRKHDSDELITNQEINNQNANIRAHYQDSDDANAWKKRHIEHATSTESTATNITDNLNTTNCFNIASNFDSSNQIATAHVLSDDFNNSTQQMDTTISNINNNNNNNDNTISNNNDITFNLIGSSSFINDLFGYDAGLVVPVSVACASSASILPATPTFTTISNANEPFDESTNWQATDLLELDHRYNSGLQTEITQLTPTLNLRQPINNNSTSIGMAQQTPQQAQQTTSDAHFLVPQKQIINDEQETINATLPKYRTVPNLPNLENLPKTDSECDFEDKNLSWLLNFKFDELPHLSPDISGGNNAINAANQGTVNGKQNAQPNSNSSAQNDSSRSRSPKASVTKTGKKFEELVMEVTSELDGNDMVVGENVIVEDSPAKVVKKPPFTYTELIEYALEDKGELTVSGIYQWISDRFPYYKSNDDRWKNSVRHNLSINPHFRKGIKAPQGAGHLWTISSGDSAENVLAWEHKKQRLELFFKMESINRERLQQHQQQQLQQQQQQQRTGQCVSPLNHQDCQDGQCVYEEAVKAAATITQEMQQQSTPTTTTRTDSLTTATAITTTTSNDHHQRLTNSQILNELPFNDLLSDDELRKTAGQILNGIHRDVEVQSVNSIISTYHDVLLDNDYLNPIHKDIAVNESGLRHTATQQLSHHSHHNSSQYYVTEIDPLELGIHINPMTHQVHEEEEVLFNDDFNLNYFGYNAGNDIVA